MVVFIIRFGEVHYGRLTGRKVNGKLEFKARDHTYHYVKEEDLKYENIQNKKNN